MHRDKTTPIAIRKYIADHFSNGKNFCLCDFKKICQKLRIKNTQISSVLTQELIVESIVSVGKYRPAGHSRSLIHYKLINKNILLRKKPIKKIPVLHTSQHSNTQEYPIQAALDAIVRKRLEKQISGVRAS